MGLIVLDSKVHTLLRELVHHKRIKGGLTRDPSNGEIIFDALQLLAKKENLK